MNRKSFLKSSAVLGAAFGIFPSQSITGMLSRKVPKIGLGLFSIPTLLEKGLEEGIKLMAEIGIQEFETYGPYPFTNEKMKATWAAITPRLGFSASGFYNTPIKEFKELLDRYNISVPAMHCDLYTMETNMADLAQAARTLGAKYVILPSIPEEERKNVEGYKHIAARFNQIGKKAKEEGIRFAYHNHGYGLIPESDGVVPINIIFQETDPELVFFEMDVFWTVAGKADPVSLLKQHQGRYKLIHIKDMKQISYFQGNGSTPSEWMSLFPQLVSAGEGQVPLKEIITTAMKTGVEHYIIEHDFAPEPKKNIQSACRFLQSLDI